MSEYNYGRIIANRFLLNYSEKLWGLPTSKLNPEIGGKRLKGLDLKSFLLKAIKGKNHKGKDMEGDFYYPSYGIGELMDKLKDYCGDENVLTDSKITRVFHTNNQIDGIEINNTKNIDSASFNVNTLPLPLLLRIMSPSPPENILKVSNSLKFRHLRMVVFFINKPTINNAATMYFPDERYPFTRVYEPRNRSNTMSPKNKTSLAIEIPCFTDDAVWSMSVEEIINLVEAPLLSTGLFKEEEIIDSTVFNLYNAYPVLDVHYQDTLKIINEYFRGFNNLYQSGRSGKFVYEWIHNMMRYGIEIIDEIRSKEN